ncbi:MAG: hypothetical protein E6J20_20010 [Chloroflexi bacterium]|nr:MAG: hypothetical protein E6J20_20010 [Chloroflexota bacterium]
MPVTVYCRACGTMMRVPPVRLREGRKKFCSRACIVAARRARSLADHLAAHSVRSGEHLLWTGRPNASTGYGDFTWQGKRSSAHRAAWETANGKAVPSDLCGLHTCDIRHCIEPTHLFLGTKGDNNRDRTRKGRSAKGDRSGPRTHPERFMRGETHWKARPKVADVRTIRRRVAEGPVSLAALGREYGVNSATIGKVVQYKIWRSVE